MGRGYLAGTLRSARNGAAGQAYRNIFAKFRLKNRVQVTVSATVFRSAMHLDDVVQAGGAQSQPSQDVLDHLA
jgi:hypothetical protein